MADFRFNLQDITRLFTSSGPALPESDLEMVLEADRDYAGGRASGAGCRVRGTGCRVLEARCGVLKVRCRVQMFWGLRFRV
jgi:hypothetical protein